MGAVLAAYESRTPGVDCGDNTTVLLADDAEPQSDLHVRILPECGGRSKTEDDFLVGAPELAIEIAVTSRAIDLHRKMDDYARYGVREYLVACVKEQNLRWFDLAGGKELAPDESGVYRINVFPGLWINGPALLAHDYAKLMETFVAGLATPEHAAFVKRLAERKAELERTKS